MERKTQHGQEEMYTGLSQLYVGYLLTHSVQNNKYQNFISYFYFFFCFKGIRDFLVSLFSPLRNNEMKSGRLLWVFLLHFSLPFFILFSFLVFVTNDSIKKTFFHLPYPYILSICKQTHSTVMWQKNHEISTHDKENHEISTQDNETNLSKGYDWRRLSGLS